MVFSHFFKKRYVRTFSMLFVTNLIYITHKFQVRGYICIFANFKHSFCVTNFTVYRTIECTKYNGIHRLSEIAFPRIDS